MAIKQAGSKIFTLNTDAGKHGYAMGLRGQYRGHYTLPQPASEDAIVEVVRNLCECAAEGTLTERLLRQDVCLIVGYLLSNC